MIDCIYKPKGSRIWRWKYRQQPKDGKIQDISLRTSDKQVAEKRRAESLREKQHERDGLILAKPLREAAQVKMSEHLEDFLGDMRRRGKSEKYLANLESQWSFDYWLRVGHGKRRFGGLISDLASGARGFSSKDG